MASPSLAIQKALFAVLEGAGFAVWDNRTAAGEKPYLIIGEDTITPDDTSCDHGYDGDVLVRCFADGAAREASKTLEAQVLAALRPKLVVPDYSVTVWSYEGTIGQAVEDGLAHQRMITFRVLLRGA